MRRSIELYDRVVDGIVGGNRDVLDIARQGGAIALSEDDMDSSRINTRLVDQEHLSGFDRFALQCILNSAKLRGRELVRNIAARRDFE